MIKVSMEFKSFEQLKDFVLRNIDSATEISVATPVSVVEPVTETAAPAPAAMEQPKKTRKKKEAVETTVETTAETTVEAPAQPAAVTQDEAVTIDELNILVGQKVEALGVEAYARISGTIRMHGFDHLKDVRARAKPEDLVKLYEAVSAMK